MTLGLALETAIAAAHAAGDLLRRDFHRPDGPRGGGDKAPADTEAEHIIRARLLAGFPGWGYRGEETGSQAGTPGAPTWLVDPNDGTRDYLVGRRGSAVSIGLVAEGQPVLGVVFVFAYPDDAGDLFTWAEGEGPLLRNGTPVDVRLAERLDASHSVLVSSSADQDIEGNLRAVEPARYRSVPSIAHRLALVAVGEGAAAVSLFAPGDWDYAAGHALVRASGGVLIDEAARPVHYDAHGRSSTRQLFAGSAAVVATLQQHPWSLPPSARTGARPTRVPRGRSIADAGLVARAQGCLLGQVAGDSLGALVEFQSQAEIARRYPDGPRLLADGGTWHTLAGQATDDSEMALALARSIVAAGRHLAPQAFEAYREWKASSPFDIGNTTRSALGGSPQPDSQANGSLMRASPLAVFAHALRPARAAELARADSALTHPHPVCGDAVALFVVAGAHAIRSGEGGEATYHAALRWARSNRLAPGVLAALEAAQDAAPRCDGETIGFVLIALQNAFHELLHATSLESGVVATVRRGGDTDTNAAIAGALLGAAFGRNAVPRQWREAVLSCRPHALRAHHPRPPAYWPCDVLELAECLLIAGNDEAEREAALPPG